MKLFSPRHFLFLSLISIPFQGFSNTEFRKEKKYSIGGQFGFMGGIVLPGVYGFWHQSPNLHIGLSYAQGAANLTKSIPSADSLQMDKVEVSSQLASVDARYYFGNSFSILGGLFYRKIKTTLDMSTTTIFPLSIKSSTSSAAFGPIFAAGNHWTLDNGFHFGCDWIGITIPLSGSYSTQNSTSGLPSTTQVVVEETSEKLGKTFSSSPIWTYLNLQIGYSF